MKWMFGLVLGLSATGGEAPTPLAPAPKHTPIDAIQWALVDQLTLEADQRQFFRYVWIPPAAGDEAVNWVGATSYAINSISRSDIIALPTLLAGGWLLRFDLRNYAATPDDFTRLQVTWDSCAVLDPYFHIAETAIDADFPIAIAARWLDETHVAAMAQLNFSPALVYRADWFLIEMVLSSLQGRGKYYGFAGLPRGDSKSDQQAVLAQVGLEEQTARNLRGDRRAMVLRSGVTGKHRRVDYYHGMVGDVWITRDSDDNDRATDNNPFFRTLKFNDTAREVLIEKSSGLHLFALFDDREQLQFEVPPDIAMDWTIPDGHTKRLEASLSCIVCHGMHDGLWPVQSDLISILKTQADIVAESNPDVVGVDPVQRLVQLYARGLDSELARGRQDYDQAVRRATIMVDGGMSAKQLSATIRQMRDTYRYRQIGAEMAMIDVGTPGAEIEEVFAGSSNPMLAALRAGLSITRMDWELVYHDAMAVRLQNIPITETNPK